MSAVSYDTNTCPRCGREQEDMDGFGLLACVGVNDGTCDYCTHPSQSGVACGIGEGEDSVVWYCDACGKDVT